MTEMKKTVRRNVKYQQLKDVTTIRRLTTIVNKYVVDQRGKKLYTCFVDFQKAFDSVWHDALFRKLENKGINGPFLNLIKNIYQQTECAVKINGKSTKYFSYEKGVQQGNPLSPILFNLFINDIFEEIYNDSEITLDEQNNINALMYADDLIIMATSPEKLQESLDKLSQYCQKWKMNVNVKKTQCMIFSKGSNVKKVPFKINNNLVQHTKEYKYLGIHVNAKNCSFSPSLIDEQSHFKTIKIVKTENPNTKKRQVQHANMQINFSYFFISITYTL